MAISLPVSYAPQTPGLIRKLFRAAAKEATAPHETPALAHRVLSLFNHRKILPLPPYPRSEDTDHYSGYKHPQELQPVEQRGETPQGPLEQFYAAQFAKTLSCPPLPAQPLPALPENQLPDLAYRVATALRTDRASDALQLKWRLIPPKSIGESQTDYDTRVRPRLDELAKHLYLATETTPAGKTICLPVAAIATFTDQTVYKLRKELAAAGLKRTAHPTLQNEQPKPTAHTRTLETHLEATDAPSTVLQTIKPTLHATTSIAAPSQASIDDYVALYATKTTVRAQTKKHYLEQCKERGLTGAALALELYYQVFEQPVEAHTTLYKDKYLYTQKEIAAMAGLSGRQLRSLVESHHVPTRAELTRNLKAKQLEYIGQHRGVDDKLLAVELGLGKTTVAKYKAQVQPLRKEPDVQVFLPLIDERLKPELRPQERYSRVKSTVLYA